MITLVTCFEPGCPNEGVEYRMEDASPVVMCGGCKKDLVGVPVNE